MTTEPKKRTRNTNGPLTATQAADRLAPIIGGLADRIRIARDNAESDEIELTHQQVQRVLSRVPERERQLVGKVLLALGCDLSGFELVPSNDVSPASAPPGEPDNFPPSYDAPPTSDAIPDRLKEPPPPLRAGERKESVRR